MYALDILSSGSYILSLQVLQELLDRGAIVSDSDLASASVNLSVQDYRCWRVRANSDGCSSI